MDPIGQPVDHAARLARLARSQRSLWLAFAMALIGLIAFVLLLNLLPDLGENVGEAVLIALGLLLSLVPAALWLGFFYRLDQIDPEPKARVLSVFLLGALLTAALHDPILHGFFHIDDWLYQHWWARLLGGILVVGFWQQALIYLTLRFGVLTKPEFDERTDGVIYAMAAGLGLATVLNFDYVVARGGVDLDIGSLRMVVNALAFASFAGIQGYFWGQARFERTPIYYLPAGVSLAALINGLFWFTLAQTSDTGFAGNPWLDLVFAALLALLTFGFVFWLILRANEETLRLARQAEFNADPAIASLTPTTPTEVP